MKWIIRVAAIALTIFSLSPLFTTEAAANAMNGVGNCSGGVCTKMTCPAGTCSKAGTNQAIDARFCSKANCRKK